MGELKERFLSVYNNAVHRDGSDMLLRWLEDSDFFVVPASTKFHGCHEGGLECGIIMSTDQRKIYCATRHFRQSVL